MDRSDKYEIGKIYFQFFQFQGQRYVTSHLLKEIDSEGRLLFTPVKALSPTRSSLQVANMRFLTYDELKASIGADQGTAVFVDDHKVDDFSDA